MQSVSDRLFGAAELFSRDSREWKIPAKVARVLAVSPFILAVVVAATVPFRDFYLWLVEEDSLIEWMQFGCLVGAIVFLVVITSRLLQRRHVGMAALYGAVALGVLFLTGEEISWGQRIFGWGTPEALQEVNRQGETTVHNIRGVQEFVPYAMLLASLYGTCVPLWAAVRKRWKRSAASHLLVPPLCLLPAFGLAALYRLFRLVIWPTPTFVVSEYGEVMELSLYFGLAMFCWFNLRNMRRPRPETGLENLRQRAHRKS